MYDPEKLPTTSGKEVKGKAPKLVGKQYVVYFYADSTFGFVTPKQIRPFNEETVQQFATGQKVGKKYQDCFVKAVALAEQESKLPPAERVSWHYSHSSSDESDTEGAAEVVTDVSQIPGRKRAPSDLYFQEDPATCDDKHPASIDNSGDEEEEEADVSDEAEDGPESESDFEVRCVAQWPCVYVLPYLDNHHVSFHRAEMAVLRVLGKVAGRGNVSPQRTG